MFVFPAIYHVFKINILFIKLM